MTDPEKLARAFMYGLAGYIADPMRSEYAAELAAEIATVLRAARNEGRDEREREIFGDEPLMMAERLDTLARVLVDAAQPTAKVFRHLAAAIRSKKDSGHG